MDFPLGSTGRVDAMKRLLSSAATEGGEEFLESMGQTALQRITYDPDAQWDFSDALYQAGVGAALGAATADPFLIGLEEGRILSNAELAEMENGLDTKSNSNYVTDAFHSLCTLVQNQRNAYTEYKTYSSVHSDVQKENGEWRRGTYHDTEAKLFEYFADLYEMKPFKSITMLSERGMCKSCQGVMEQFQKQFPDVTITVVSNKQVEGNVWRYRR